MTRPREEESPPLQGGEDVKRSREPGDRRSEQWLQDTIYLCTEALQRIEQFESGSESFDHDDLRQGMKAMVQRISRHAGEAVGTDVDEEVIIALQDASLACQAVSDAQIKIGDSSEWDAAVERATAALEHARTRATQSSLCRRVGTN